MIPQFLWGHRWARMRQGGRWEQRDGQWYPVAEWSTPKDLPELYGRGQVPVREEWPRESRG